MFLAYDSTAWDEEFRIADSIIALSSVARQNIQCDVGDAVGLHRIDEKHHCVRVSILPVEGSVNGFAGSLVDTFLTPHFQESRPVCKGDMFTVKGFLLSPDFKIMDFEPAELPWGLVSATTDITCENHPISRDDAIGISAADDVGGVLVKMRTHALRLDLQRQAITSLNQLVREAPKRVRFRSREHVGMHVFIRCAHVSMLCVR